MRNAGLEEAQAAINICRDFGAQKNKVSHRFSVYLP